MTKEVYMRKLADMQTDIPSYNSIKTEISGDAISRQALLDDFGFSEKTRKYGGDHSGYNTMMLYEIQDIIESQPPVNPQKIGHWIWQTENIYRCSECGEDIYVKEVMNVPQYKCCPMCMAKMIEKQESEEVYAESNN